ncbi:MAG: hypothetical protein Ct9H300mP1_32640 [Planctomycetaceae bacterium]|nr:MAG: hypothetical protein Ct9H300mP1_32640 [Planctomycetaceae bacterium]
MGSSSIIELISGQLIPADVDPGHHAVDSHHQGPASAARVRSSPDAAAGATAFQPRLSISNWRSPQAAASRTALTGSPSPSTSGLTPRRWAQRPADHAQYRTRGSCARPIPASTAPVRGLRSSTISGPLDRFGPVSFSPASNSSAFGRPVTGNSARARGGCTGRDEPGLRLAFPVPLGGAGPQALDPFLDRGVLGREAGGLEGDQARRSAKVRAWCCPWLPSSCPVRAFARVKSPGAVGVLDLPEPFEVGGDLLVIRLASFAASSAVVLCPCRAPGRWPWVGGLLFGDLGGGGRVVGREVPLEHSTRWAMSSE